MIDEEYIMQEEIVGLTVFIDTLSSYRILIFLYITWILII